jgi:magnesium chelatase family protein
LAIVSAVLAAAGVFGGDGLAGSVLLGELGLDGRVRPVRGVLPATLAASQAGFRRVIVPLRQAAEARLVEGIDVFGVGSLGQLIALFRGDQIPDVEPASVGEEPTPQTGSGQLDMADVGTTPKAGSFCRSEPRIVPANFKN